MKESPRFLFSSTLPLGCEGEGAESDNEIVKNWVDATRQL